MLPDFAHMLGQRVSGLANHGLRSSERHHRKTDACFHRCSTFLALLRDATAALTDAGLGRGPARGAAHVGIELLCDGALVDDPHAQASYLGALEAAPELESAIHWSSPEGTLHWQRLQSRLRMNGLPYALRDPMRVTERFARALEGRPRLRIAPHERAIVERWVVGARPQVDRAAPELLAQTLAAIA